MNKLPVYTVDLIDMLDEMYPEQSANPKDSEREIWIKVGKRELVRALIYRKDSEEKTKYEKELM